MRLFCSRGFPPQIFYGLLQSNNVLLESLDLPSEPFGFLVPARLFEALDQVVDSSYQPEDRSKGAECPSNRERNPRPSGGRANSYSKSEPASSSRYCRRRDVDVFPFASHFRFSLALGGVVCKRGREVNVPQIIFDACAGGKAKDFRVFGGPIDLTYGVRAFLV